MWTLLKEIKVKQTNIKTTKKPWTEMANYRAAIKMHFFPFLKKNFCLIIYRPTGPITVSDSEGIDPSVSCCHICSFWVFFPWEFCWFHNWGVEWRMGKSPKMTCCVKDRHSICPGCGRGALHHPCNFPAWFYLCFCEDFHKSKNPHQGVV